MTERPRVLVSAYACHPRPSSAHFPGEAILGWSLANEITRFADVHVVTWAFNRPGLEGTLAGNGGKPAVVHYVDLPPRIHRALRDRHYGVRFYYFLWQREAAKFARRLAREERFDQSCAVVSSRTCAPSRTRRTTGRSTPRRSGCSPSAS